MKGRRVVLAIALVAGAAGCAYVRDFDYSRGARMAAGDPHAGREKMRKHNCTSCHVIPGIPDADGHAGPPLNGWAKKDVFLRTVPNTPENVMRFILRPTDVKPTTPMPAMNLSEHDAHDIAAYLFSINK